MEKQTRLEKVIDVSTGVLAGGALLSLAVTAAIAVSVVSSLYRASALFVPKET